MVIACNRITNVSPFDEVSYLHTYDHGIYICPTGTGRKKSFTKGFAPIIESEPCKTEGAMLVWGSGGALLAVTEKPSELVINKEIDMDKLKTTIDASDEEVNQCLGSLLEDYEIESTAENIELAGAIIKLWLKQQSSTKGVELKEDELSKLFKFTVGLAREALYVGSA